MKLKNGNRFDIEGDDPSETITFVMSKGTVDEVTTRLDGVEKILARGEELTFNVSTGIPRKLLAVYVFKDESGESYETHVTGSAVGDESVDDFKQKDGQANMERLYTFNEP